MIAIIGAGIGGLAAAIALRRVGAEVQIFEQTAAFKRVGAAINMTPNAVKVLNGLGIGDTVRETAHISEFRISRTWDSGEETSKVPLGDTGLDRYGATSLHLHRADLLAALQDAVPTDCVHLGKKLVSMDDRGDRVEIQFDDGTSTVADGVLGADGIHSEVRQELFGPDRPSFTGMVAYRSTVPVSRLPERDYGNFVKWWGPTADIQIVTFLISSGEDLFVFATVPESDEAPESWSTEGEVEVLKASFANFHPEAREIIDGCDQTLRTALYEREPLDHWHRGNVALLGDACHAMTPFMAQGAGMGLEDAAILSRCVDANANWATAIAQYERTRIERASRIQRGSHDNNWLREQGNPDWVYGYDAWTTELL